MIVTVGPVESTWNLTTWSCPTFPAMSVAKTLSVWAPSFETENGCVYVVSGPPSREYVIESTPEPSSVALSVIVGFEYHPLTAGGENDTVVTGADYVVKAWKVWTDGRSSRAADRR